MAMHTLICLVVVAFATSTIALRESYKGRQRLVGYWGQNGAGSSYPKPNWEKPLDVTCRDSKFDIIAISFLIIFWDSRQHGLPALNFACHCETPISPKYPFLLRCPEIEAGIKQCQKLGKKVVLSVGGATGDGTLPSQKKAVELADTFWDFFLGGNRTEGTLVLRPFGTAILDGIDFDIEGGRGPSNYQYLIKELRTRMDADPKKEYLITGAPQCPYPDHFLGPGPGTGLGEVGQLVDHLYVQFYNNYCYTGAGSFFHDSLLKWLDFAAKQVPHGPLIFIGMPAAPRGASGSRYYNPPDQLRRIYLAVRDKPGVGGIMLWDASWDQNNVIGGKRYSAYAFAVLKRSTNPTPPPPATTTAAPPPPPTTTGVPPPPATTTTAPSPPPTTKAPTTIPPVPFSCANTADGIYPNPTDCAKFIICAGGKRHNYTCPKGTKFNKELKICDWSSSVNC